MVLYKESTLTNSRKYYVEFVGQHTAGKTITIKEIVDSELLAPKVAVYPQKIKRSQFNFILALPLLVIKHINDLYFVIKFLVLYTSWSWINYHAVGRHLLKMVLLHPYYCENYDFDIWFKDDMLHLLPRLQFNKNINVEDIFKTYFFHFSDLYDGIVYIDLPYEVMIKRFENRFRTRDVRRRENRTPVYERAFRQNLILRKVISEQKNIPFLILDGTDVISDNAKKVAEFVKTYVY